MLPIKIIQNPNQTENINASSSSTIDRIKWDVFFNEEESYQLKEYQKLLDEKQMIEWEMRNAKEIERKAILANYRQSLLVRIMELEKDLGSSYENDNEEETEEKEPEGAASTSEGKEVIKAEITQELEKSRNIFEKFPINPIEYSKAKNEIKEKLLELHERRGCEAEINLMTSDAIDRLILGREEIQRRKHEKAELVAEALGKAVMKMASDTITDLQAHKDKIVKKINKLIDARNAEVIQAREIIKALETVNQEARAKNRDLREKLERETRNLQRDIEKLNNQLKEIQNKEASHAKLYQEELNRHLQKSRGEKPKITSVINNEEQAKIRELEEEKSKLLLSADFFQKQAEQRALELKDEKESHERTKTLLNADLKAKENELERERNIFTNQIKESGDKIKKLERKISELNTKIDEKDEEINQQQPTINELRGEKDRLNDLLNEARREKSELETKYNALVEKSLFYKAMDKLGIVSLKNSISNVAVIAGLVVIIYGISWMYKNLIKTAYKNFKGEPKPENNHEPTPPIPTNQNQPQVILVPPQRQTPPTNYYQPPQISSIENQEPPQLNPTSENTRTPSNESPKNEPRRDREKIAKKTRRAPS